MKNYVLTGILMASMALVAIPMMTIARSLDSLTDMG